MTVQHGHLYLEVKISSVILFKTMSLNELNSLENTKCKIMEKTLQNG